MRARISKLNRNIVVNNVNMDIIAKFLKDGWAVSLPKWGEKSTEIRIRDAFGESYYPVENLEIKVSEICHDPKYADYEWKERGGDTIIGGKYDHNCYRRNFILYVLRNETVAHIDDEKKKIWFEKGDWDLDKMIDKSKDRVRAISRKREAQKYLASPFAKQWLKKMRFTVKESETGIKYYFLSILPGYKKIPRHSFQKLCQSICEANYESEFSMNMYIGGKVDWTLFYEQPFTHVNGCETYSCGALGKDNYSPDDWERDMAKLKRELGHPVTQEEYISFMFKKKKGE